MTTTNTNTAADRFNAAFAAADTFTPRMQPITITTVEARDGFELKQALNTQTGAAKYQLFWDGELLSTIYNMREAIALLNDFCPIRKKRGRKAMATA